MAYSGMGEMGREEERRTRPRVIIEYSREGLPIGIVD